MAEAVANTVVGFIISLGIQVAVFKLYGIQLSAHDNVMITVIFTVASFARSYLIRRFFTRLG